MKFAERFPDVLPGEWADGLVNLRMKQTLHCAECGDDTLFFDIGWSVPLCSDECEDKWNRDYWVRQV